MITTCSQLLYASGVNLNKRNENLSIIRMNGERKHEYDPIENTYKYIFDSTSSTKFRLKIISEILGLEISRKIIILRNIWNIFRTCNVNGIFNDYFNVVFTFWKYFGIFWKHSWNIILEF